MCVYIVVSLTPL